jgi:hypothetical protein
VGAIIASDPPGRLGLWLSVELKQAVEAAARQQGLSASAYARVVLGNAVRAGLDARTLIGQAPRRERDDARA